MKAARSECAALKFKSLITDLASLASSSSGSLSESFFVDLQRIQLQLQQFQTLSERHMKEMNDFERTANDDFQRVWDNINELHEITNITLKNMEDIYDKDILPLQNFKTSTENEMNKLREEMENFLSLRDNRNQQADGLNYGNSSDQASAMMTKTIQKVVSMEEEQQRHT